MTEVRIATLAIVDLVDSTRLFSAMSDRRMADVLGRHDRIARDLINAERGREIDRTDGFLALFERPVHAVRFCLAYHAEVASLASETGTPLAARAGVHLGEVVVRENHPSDVARGAKPLEVDGIAKPVTARLASLARPGQTLLGRGAFDLAARASLENPLPAGTRFVRHGVYWLKGIDTPVEVYEAGVEGVAPLAPPQDGEKAVRDRDVGRLPCLLNRFVGRRREADEVTRLLESNRLLTLTGPGGCGKTRLALQVAAEVADRFDHGAWFVDLASVADGGGVPQAVSSSLGVDEEPGVAPEATLFEFLRDRSALIVLDNCEHVLDAAARVVETTLGSCPAVRVLATSREALGVVGVASYPLASLQLPDPGAPADELARCEAVQLFVDRATAVQPSFRLVAGNAAAVAQIVLRLDGIPLAIELAAARVRAMNPDQIARRLDDRFRLLVGGRGQRQHTLRALIDWSHDLLSAPEKALLRRLSVFSGGFTLESVEAVAAYGTIGAFDVVDLLARLVEKSLVAHDAATDRYRLLETIRQYARDRLAEAGEADEARGQHFAWVTELVADLGDAWGPDDEAALRRELENVRAALDHARASPGDRLRLAADLAGFWLASGLWQEGRAALASALAAAPEPALERARALIGAAAIAREQGDFDAVAKHAAEALELASASGWELPVAQARHLVGAALAARSGADAAVPSFRAAVSACLAADPSWRRVPLLSWGSALVDEARLAEARPLIEEALAVARQAGDRRIEALALSDLAAVEMWAGELQAARAQHEQARALAPHGSRAWSNASYGLAFTTFLLRRYAEARAIVSEALHRSAARGERRGMSSGLLVVAACALEEGRLDEAVRLGEGCLGLRERWAIPIPPVEQAFVEVMRSRLVEHFGAERYASLRATAAASSAEELLGLAQELSAA
jgi:predicted ATPase/class 3 adenylate cyclase